MAIRSIASLSLTFGLVSIPVKVYLATESSAALKFKLMAASGARVRQQYVADDDPVHDLLSSVSEETVEGAPEDMPSEPERSAVIAPFPTCHLRAVPFSAEPYLEDEPRVIERAEMVKGYEFEKGQFVLFTAAELKALEAESRHTIDIVSFIPEQSVDPIFYDKAYFLAPDKRGGKPYSLLRRAMQETGRCALAKWAWRSKEYVVQIRPAQGGMVLQQLLYADEVRSIDSLGIELVAVGDTELTLAKQLIEQIGAKSYDPHAFVDEEKQRILAAVERKISGQEIVTHGEAQTNSSALVVDLVAALRASLVPSARGQRATAKSAKGEINEMPELSERKPARRAPTTSRPRSSRPRKAAS